MKKFVLAIVMAAFCVTAAANGNENNSHDHALMDASTTATMTAEQTNSVYLGGAGAPAMSAASFDCNIVSKSYSILIWSYGRSKCEKGSVVWRDVYNLVQYAKVLGLDADGLAGAIQRRVCSNRKMRKTLGNCPVVVRVSDIREEGTRK